MSDIKKGISNEEIAIKYDVPKKILTWVKNKGKYFKALEPIPIVREVEAALDWTFYVITFLFSVRNEDRKCKNYCKNFKSF